MYELRFFFLNTSTLLALSIIIQSNALWGQRQQEDGGVGIFYVYLPIKTPNCTTMFTKIP